MKKYAPLTPHLRDSRRAAVPMTFPDIEQVIGAPLPESASRHRAWWSNNPTNNVMTKAWLEAGYESTHVDMAGRKLVFQKTARDKGSGRRFSDVFGALRGTVTVAPGTDLTDPIGEDWDAAR